MTSIPNTQELYSSHIPALQALMAMGYEYLFPSEVLLRQVIINRHAATSQCKHQGKTEASV